MANQHNGQEIDKRIDFKIFISKGENTTCLWNSDLLSMSVSMSSDSTAALGLWIFGLMTKGHSFLDRSTSCYIYTVIERVMERIMSESRGFSDSKACCVRKREMLSA